MLGDFSFVTRSTVKATLQITPMRFKAEHMLKKNPKKHTHTHTLSGEIRSALPPPTQNVTIKVKPLYLAIHDPGLGYYLSSWDPLFICDHSGSVICVGCIHCY